MERLNLSEIPENSHLEAALHVARYATASALAAGLSVLDVACGEGYGSDLLIRSGAKSVTGVDIDPESIAKAQSLFGKNGLEYIHDDATVLSSLGDRKFDLIVSLETFEHVQDGGAFLENLKKFAHEETIFIVSCPNDYWYYPEENQSNPWHIRKYDFPSFKNIATSALGSNVVWSFGLPTIGFTNYGYDGELELQENSSWLNFEKTQSAFLIPRQSPTYEKSSAFYLGIWNASGLILGSAAFPIDMDMYASAMQGLNGDTEILRQGLSEATTGLSILREDNDTLRKALEEAQVALEILRNDNDTLRGLLRDATP